MMRNLTRIILSLTLGLTMTLVNALSSFAQSSTPSTDNNTGYQTNEQDSSSTLGGSFEPFDLIHNMNLNRGNFDVEASNNHINQEANDFKAIQQQRLLEMLHQNNNSSETNTVEETQETEI